MTKKVNLAPFKLRTSKGWIWIENSETGTKGPVLQATTKRASQCVKGSRVSIPKSQCLVSGFEEGASAPFFLPCQEKYAPKKLTKSRG